MDEARAPIAAIDVGSNTIHLTVAWPSQDGHGPRTLVDVTELVRLGVDVAASGRIGAERMAYALATIAEQANKARAAGAEVVLGIATEGVRAAENGAELLARARDEAGVVLRLISGEQEAALTYWGATSGAADPARRRAVVDLGGGSMELVVGAGSRVLWRISLPVGSGVLLEHCVRNDPPGADDVARVRAAAAEGLRAVVPPLPVEEVLVCGGTATTLAALAPRAAAAGEMALSTSTAAAMPGEVGVLARDTLESLVGLLGARPAREVAARYDVALARAPLLMPGAVTLGLALETLDAEAMTVSRRGVREGAIMAYAHRGESWLEAATSGDGWE